MSDSRPSAPSTPSTGALVAKTVATATTSAALATAVAARGGQPLDMAVALGALALAAPGVGLLFDMLQRAVATRAELAGPTFLARREQAQREGHDVEGNEATPEAARAALAGMRALLDAVDDATVPAIARLVAEYTSEGRQPDRFFRGASRFLADLSAEDMLTTRALLEAMVKLEAEAGAEPGNFVRGDTFSYGDHRVHLWIVVQGTRISEDVELPRVRVLEKWLREHDLVESRLVEGDGAHAFILPLERVHHLLAIVGR